MPEISCKGRVVAETLVLGVTVNEVASRNDVLRAGCSDALDGVRDTFVFAEGYDFDTIRGFENGTDLIDVQAFGFDSFADVQALTEDRPSGLRIDFGGGDVLFINDVTLADLDQSDVIL